MNYTNTEITQRYHDLQATVNRHPGGGGGLASYASQVSDDAPGGSGRQAQGEDSPMRTQAHDGPHPSRGAEEDTTSLETNTIRNGVAGMTEPAPTSNTAPPASSNILNVTPEQGDGLAPVETEDGDQRDWRDETMEEETTHETNARRPPKDRTGCKRSRAALRVASLNMKGGGSGASRNKWKTLSDLMRDESLSILAVQETHLTEEHKTDLQARYNRVEIISSPDPDNASGKGGVAILLNKYNTNWNSVEAEYTIPGRVLTVTVQWGHTSKIKIAAIYAPAGTVTEKAEFWTSLRDIWRADPTKRPDVLLGDLNMVENSIDRLPAKSDNARVTEPFAEVCSEAKLIDGYQITHLGEKPKYTYKTLRRGQVNSRSRIDRIHVTEEVFNNSYEWNIIDTGMQTLDHYMVTAYLATDSTPYVGKGRSTIADFLLDFPELQDSFLKRARKLELDLERCRESRSESENPQTLWKEFKKDLLTIARDFSRKRSTMLDKEIEMWQRRKERLHDLANLEENEDELVLLDEIEDNITDLLAAKKLRQKTKIEARHHFVAETNTKYDYILHREKKPRDTIPRLKKPGTGPAQYTTVTNEMLEIATEHHESLQGQYDHNPESQGAKSARANVLKGLKKKLGSRDRTRLGRRIRGRDVERAALEISNGKASGLDGIPIEVWKSMIKNHQRTKKEAERDGGKTEVTANLVAILTSVLNDIMRHGVAAGTDFAEGWMCPLYKKKDRAEISNYRPITVLNTDYKILTKILTNRLSKVATKLIHPDQAGFIKGRSIFDQTELIRLVMHPTSGKKGAIVCLDQEKAYDKIDHAFLWATLKKIGCPDSFIKTIKHLYADAKTSIIMNGVAGRKFSITRGVRQGDPLSCLLFDLAIESLASALRKSRLKGLTFEGMKDRLIANLFADDTTVFLSSEDSFGDLVKILDQWCMASGAKFNIDKTTVIPLGNEIYRHRMRRRRKIRKGSARIPANVHIAQEGEPVRILGAYFGYEIDEDDVWEPVITKLDKILDRWSKNHPTIRGLTMGHNTMVGGLTQYLTRVQGMPKSTEEQIKKKTDDFVWAKNGERKANTIAMSTLQKGKDEGGLGLLDIEARNEAIDLVRLRTYLLPPEQRPVWCIIADIVLARAAVLKFRNVGERGLVNPFLQTWRVNLSSKDLPSNLRRMMAAAYKYNTKFAATEVTNDLKLQMPIWYHIGAKPKLESIYGDNWGLCQRETHDIVTVGNMLEHAERLNTTGCSKRKNCKCANCKRDREKGCENPTKCRQNAVRKLNNLTGIWDPRIETPEGASAEIDAETQEGPYTAAPHPLPRYPHPADHIRVFTDPEEIVHGTIMLGTPTAVETEDEHGEVEVYTDGSCHENGTANAKCGSGIWYGDEDERNTALRIGDPHPQTNNTGELIAALVSIQQNKGADKLKIVSDSQYTIDTITKLAREWMAKGFVGVKNPDIVRALLGEVATSKTTILLKKVKGHSGDPGNDGADEWANRGARKDTPDNIDLSAGEKLRALGAKANELTQRNAYKLIKERANTGERARTERTMSNTRATIESLTGTNHTPEHIWKSLRQRKKGVLTQKFSVFAWKALHRGHKVGEFWKYINPDRHVCPQCNAPVENLEHIFTECRVSGQETVWALAKRAWQRTGLPWPEITLGLILGISVMEVKDSNGKVLDGRTRLLRIIISESAYLIWLLRCEWRIGREQNVLNMHTRKEISARWKIAIERRLRLDWALTNKLAFGKKALRPAEVKRTWKGIASTKNQSVLRTFPEDEGVLVGTGGIANQLRPPGRNR
ncbi:hypothetical protein D9611_005853 [Ephemerocybe angulata]|uniref:Reverse transcriptase n=1 Tax=Ephemerocybe angulata TaxID=980116 RepID=A0A8H5CG04_9AGAR|nr:hypothetical protein D9611_005853 [Tulosesus angulatus]